MSWKIVNEVSCRKISNKSKLKASNQKVIISIWQKHFQEFLGCVIITADEEEIPQINEELNIQKGIFTLDELSTEFNLLLNILLYINCFCYRYIVIYIYIYIYIYYQMYFYFIYN